MENNLSRLKCPQCNLVNFGTAEVCKRCAAPLLKSDSQLAPEPLPSTQAELHEPSQNEDTATQAGRLLRMLPTTQKTSITKVVAVGAITVFCLIAVLGTVVLGFIYTKREVAAANRNHEAARSALNAVAEIQSVTSVGSTYPQYIAAIQSAKIKFDAAMRDYVSRDAGDRAIVEKLEEAFANYTDAGDAWAEFIQNGDRFGFISESNSVVKTLAAQYDFDAIKASDDDMNPQFYKDDAMQAIWRKAGQNTNSITLLLRRNDN